MVHKVCCWSVFTDTTDDEGNVTTAADNEAAFRAKVDADVLRQYVGTRSKADSSDWTQMADSPLDSDKTEWITYRQSLRDLPTASGFLLGMTWPEEPGS